MKSGKNTERGREAMTIIAIIVLALVLFLVLTANRSGANFSASSSNGGNLFSTGTLTLSNSKADQVVVNADSLMPGQSRSGSLHISVSGDYSAAVTVAGSADSSALSDALTLTIVNASTSITVYSGSLGGFDGGPLGTFAPGAAPQTIQFTLAFPAGNATAGLQNRSTAMTLVFTGVAQ